MESRRFLIFMAALLLVFMVNNWLWNKFAPPPAKAPPQADKKAAAKPGEAGQKPAAAAPAAEPAQAAAPTPAAERLQWFTLGSYDPQSRYRMLVTLSNRGGAIERIELNSPRYTDIEDEEDQGGYLGYLFPQDGKSCEVRAVGPETPAALAGIKPGDVLTRVNETGVVTPHDLATALLETRKGEKVEIEVQRSGQAVKLSAELGRRPLKVVKVEHDVVDPAKFDPPSFLLSVERIDQRKFTDEEQAKLHTGWWTAANDPARPDEVVFECELLPGELKARKRFKLARATEEQADDRDARAYHLEFSVEFVNLGETPHALVYRLDGPTGLPTEGNWYSSKSNRYWFSTGGARDVAGGVRSSPNSGPYADLATCQQIVEAKKPKHWQGEELAYLAVDALYFTAALLPSAELPLHDDAEAIKIGNVPPQRVREKLTNVTFRLTSTTVEVPAKSKNNGLLAHSYEIFAGPKRPALLEQYELDDLVYYGWFWWVAQPMLWLLHTFYAVVPNYGVAIIMLTVVVRMCMFPLSRKQAISAQRMQELQPEIKKLAERYKDNPQQRMVAQQELFRKHNVRPLAGCLPILVQMPIFIGLYRSLAVDIELRQSPLISEAVRWCSNLGAPDMFWYWAPYLPDWVTGKTDAVFIFGILAVGPYLNILPLVTIALFLVQQKMFTPPATDPQQVTQQKIMKYMMVFMGLMFFRVPSGLCIYFITSSLWGIAERKLLPKVVHPSSPPPPPPRGGSSPPSNGKGPGGSKKPQRGRK